MPIKETIRDNNANTHEEREQAIKDWQKDVTGLIKEASTGEDDCGLLLLYDDEKDNLSVTFFGKPFTIASAITAIINDNDDIREHLAKLALSDLLSSLLS